MRFTTIATALAGLCAVSARSPGQLRAINNNLADQEFARREARQRAPVVEPRASNSSSGTAYLTDKTKKYSVNGKAIPDVDFDIGESYAGLMPLAEKAGNQSFYYWFFPSKNELAGDEILIWLNGGPGCSSLEGMLQENGPFIWQYGTYKPQPNPWTWTNLTNVVWVEQPIGTGFSQGPVTAKTEFDVAHQFMAFWQNFVDTFDLHGRKIFITGESYAGMYVPHIAHEMLKANDTKYYNVEATMIYDPSINSPAVTNQVPAYRMMEVYDKSFALNETFKQELQKKADTCGYNKFMDEYLTFPPKAHPLPSAPYNDDLPLECDVFMSIYNASLLVNPCWDVYQLYTTCPLLWDVLGFPGSLFYQSQDTQIYFDRPEVKKAINAPMVPWAECSGPVYNTTTGNSYEADHNLYSGLTVLPYVIENSKRTVIGHGGIDYVLLMNGTLLTIQNMTWHGQQGFQKPITGEFFVPYHDEVQLSTIAASGVMGRTHTERTLTFVEINLSGHMVPQYQPSASYRHLEFLLGRIDSLESTAPFTTSNQGYPGQPPFAADAVLEHQKGKSKVGGVKMEL